MLGHELSPNMIHLTADVRGVKRKYEDELSTILKQISGLKSSLALDTDKTIVKQKLSKCKGRVKQLKQEIREIQERHSQIYGMSLETLKLLLADCGENTAKQLHSLIQFNTQVLHMLLMNQKFEKAEQFMGLLKAQDGISARIYDLKYMLINQGHQIANDVLKNKMQSLKAWVSKHSSFLKKGSNKLEFKLILCEYINILNESGENSALQYLRKSLQNTQLTSQQKETIQKFALKLLVNQNQEPEDSLEKINMNKMFISDEEEPEKKRQLTPEELQKIKEINDQLRENNEILRNLERGTGNTEIRIIAATLAQGTLFLFDLLENFGVREQIENQLDQNGRRIAELRQIAIRLRSLNIENRQRQHFRELGLITQIPPLQPLQNLWAEEPRLLQYIPQIERRLRIEQQQIGRQANRNRLMRHDHQQTHNLLMQQMTIGNIWDEENRRNRFQQIRREIQRNIQREIEIQIQRGMEREMEEDLNREINLNIEQQIEEPQPNFQHESEANIQHQNTNVELQPINVQPQQGNSIQQQPGATTLQLTNTGIEPEVNIQRQDEKIQEQQNTKQQKKETDQEIPKLQKQIQSQQGTIQIQQQQKKIEQEQLGDQLPSQEIQTEQTNEKPVSQNQKQGKQQVTAEKQIQQSAQGSVPEITQKQQQGGSEITQTTMLVEGQDKMRQGQSLLSQKIKQIKSNKQISQEQQPEISQAVKDESQSQCQQQQQQQKQSKTVKQECLIVNRNNIVEHIRQVYASFIEAFSQIYKIPVETVFDKIIGLGITILKTNCCHEPVLKYNEKINKCPICSKEGMKLSKKLPMMSCHQSSLICRLNGSLMNHENNYPMLLPNGQLYSISGLESTKKRNKYQCPISGKFYRKDQCRKVYLV